VSDATGGPLPEELLSAYADGECTPGERIAVEARLAVDAEWARILDEVVTARAVLRALPVLEPPAGFIDELTAIGRTTIRERRRPTWRRVVAGTAAAAAVLVGFVLATPSQRDKEVAPPIATLADSHGATLSLQSDPLSGLAPIAAQPQPTQGRP
jgi:anti-sigma factor RsiW